MQSFLITLVLCFCTTVAGAQCLSKSATASAPMQHVDLKQVSTVAQRPAAPANARPALITSAAAATHDGPVAAREGNSISRASIAQPEDDEQPQRRGSTAMLLAAVALMSGIALRRFGSSGR